MSSGGSDVGTTILSMAQQIATVATNVTTTIAQIEKIAGMVPVLSHGAYKVYYDTPKFVRAAKTARTLEGTRLADGDDGLQAALKATLAALKTKSTDTFNARYSSLTPCPPTSGIVIDLSQPNDAACVIGILSDYLQAQDLPSSSDVVGNIIKLMIEETDLNLGVTATLSGMSPLNANQSLKWALAYGVFMVRDNTNALCFGFTAAFDAGV
jgi:hypothetical protein